MEASRVHFVRVGRGRLALYHRPRTVDLPALRKLGCTHVVTLLIHCSAGVHRTGTVAYGLLRWRGLSRKQALALISKTRSLTTEGMGEKRLRWGEEIARTPTRKIHGSIPPENSSSDS